MDQPKTKKMLQAIAKRQQLVKIGQRFQVMFIVFTALYLVLLLAARMFDVVPEEIISWPLHESVIDWSLIALHWPITVVLVPVFALLFSLVPMPKINQEAAAAAADQNIKSKDLFLTSLQLDNAPGEYKPLVNQEAEQRADDVKAAAAVPFMWGKPAAMAGLVLMMLFILGVFVPKMDPWGFEAEKEYVAKQKKQLEEIRKETTLRMNKLKERKEAKSANNLERLINDLKKTLQDMAPKRQVETQKQLQQVRRQLDQQFNQRKAETLQNTSQKQAVKRAVAQDKKMQQVQKDLKQGDAKKAQQAMSELQKQAEKLANAKTEEERKEAAKNIQNELEKLKQVAQNTPGGKNMERALDNAIKQAKMAQKQGLQKQAAKDLQKSLELAKQEAQKMAQNQQQMQKIQQAMKTAQMGQQANKGQGQQIQGVQGAKTLEEYQQKLQQMQGGQKVVGGQQPGQPGMQPGGGQPGQGPGQQPGQGGQPGQQPGQGQGQGNQGQGGGGVPENPDLEMASQTEKVKSSLQAGKILASWEVEGKAKRGEVTVERAKLQKDIKDAVGESIVKEQTPPDYQGAIKRYFDAQNNTKP